MPFQAATAWLAAQGLDLTAAIAPLVPGILADAWLIGGCSAQAMADGTDADLGGWQPGGTDPAQDRAEALGIGAGLGSALMQAGETASQMAAGYMTTLARALVDGAAFGLGAAGIGASLVAALSDPDGAGGLVLTVTGIGSGAALYLKRRFQRVRCTHHPNVVPSARRTRRAARTRSRMCRIALAHPKCRCVIVPAGSPAAGQPRPASTFRALVLERLHVHAPIGACPQLPQRLHARRAQPAIYRHSPQARDRATEWAGSRLGCRHSRPSHTPGWPHASQVHWQRRPGLVKVVGP